MPEKQKQLMNDLLVELFNKILTIEERALKLGKHNILTMSEIHVIEAIGLIGATTMASVANKLSITAGTLSVSINTLVKKGYVVREKAPHDRRIVHLHLTSIGLEALEEHDQFHKIMIDYTLTHLDEDERLVFVKALSKVTEYFSQQLKHQKEKL